MTREIETSAQLADILADGTLKGCYVQGLQLTEFEDALRGADVTGAVFLGCTMSSSLTQHLFTQGAIVFPVLPDVPVQLYRGQLYSPRELFDTLPEGTYAESLDHRAYEWQKDRSSADMQFSLPAALHDSAISDALEDFLATQPRRVVGVMGGHSMERGTPGYRAAALLGQLLTADGVLVATGGGPGAMEAANLGALAGRRDLHAMIDELATVPSFRPSIDAWAQVALRVLGSLGAGADSVGIPTWHYGHEPPNVFATKIAKYFSNAIREDILLARCTGGLIYLEGAAGTVQELFQAVTGNYYPDATKPRFTPLVLVGKQYWTTKVPAWPLLASLASGRPMEPYIALVDTVDEAYVWLADLWD